MSKELQKATQGQNLDFFTPDKDAMDLMSKDAENYVDETSADDMTIPRIKILQSGSGEVKKADPKRIDGAEEGDFVNTLTKEVFKGENGLYFVPAKRRITYMEYKDLSKGGGLIHNYGEDASAYNSIVADEKGRRLTSPDTEILKNYEVYGFVIDFAAKKYNTVLLSLKKSQIKKMKKWNTLIRTLVDGKGNQLPEYAGIYQLTTIPESNEQGSWFNFEVSLKGYTLAIPEIGKLVYTKAKEFAELVRNSKVQGSYEDEDINASPKQISDSNLI